MALVEEAAVITTTEEALKCGITDIEAAQKYGEDVVLEVKNDILNQGEEPELLAALADIDPITDVQIISDPNADDANDDSEDLEDLDAICSKTIDEYVTQIAAMKEGLAMDK